MNEMIVLGLPYDDVVLLDDFLTDCIRHYRRTYPIRYDEIREAQRLALEIRRQRADCVRHMRKEAKEAAR